MNPTAVLIAIATASLLLGTGTVAAAPGDPAPEPTRAVDLDGPSRRDPIPSEVPARDVPLRKPKPQAASGGGANATGGGTAGGNTGVGSSTGQTASSTGRPSRSAGSGSGSDSTVPADTGRASGDRPAGRATDTAGAGRRSEDEGGRVAERASDTSSDNDSGATTTSADADTGAPAVPDRLEPVPAWWPAVTAAGLAGTPRTDAADTDTGTATSDSSPAVTEATNPQSDSIAAPEQAGSNGLPAGSIIVAALAAVATIGIALLRRRARAPWTRGGSTRGPRPGEPVPTRPLPRMTSTAPSTQQASGSELPDSRATAAGPPEPAGGPTWTSPPGGPGAALPPLPDCDDEATASTSHGEARWGARVAAGTDPTDGLEPGDVSQWSESDFASPDGSGRIGLVATGAGSASGDPWPGVAR